LLRPAPQGVDTRSDEAGREALDSATANGCVDPPLIIQQTPKLSQLRHVIFLFTDGENWSVFQREVSGGLTHQSDQAAVPSIAGMKLKDRT